MTDATEILFDVQGGIGWVTLNRPQALNALTLNMIRLLDRQLIQWAKDDGIRAVVVTGGGDRAFCSGGDVKAVAVESRDWREGKSDGRLAQDFFREEYTLNHRIHTFPKPYIALINGIVMGGGVGVSAHGSHRVVTENASFAMPETNIGFFPDVGGGYFLPRCPGQTGTYLALTSKRIKTIDTIYTGFATHCVLQKDLSALVAALQSGEEIDAALEKLSSPPPGESELAPHRERIDVCFSSDRVEDIIAALQKDKSPWAEETLKALYAVSPTSLKVALRQIRLGARMPFAQVMTMEYRISQACMKGHDFYEGIRAALIDKDRQPKWQPSRLDDVPDEAVEGYFKPLGDKDLVLP